MTLQTDPFAAFQLADNEFQSILFDGIRTEHFLPAIREGIQRTRDKVAAIKADPAEPDFANTILALERANEDLELAAGVYYLLFGAHGTPELHALSDEISPLLAELESDLSLDPVLFARIQAVHGKREGLGLDAESLRLLEKTWLGFTRNGALLPAEQQEKLRAIDQELSTLSPQFSKNVLAATNAYELHLTDEADLAGLPEGVAAAMAHEAKRRGKEGWVATLHAPSMIPFLTYSTRRDLREAIWRAYNSRGLAEGQDNRPLIARIVRLRRDRARLLGYDTHSHYVLQERMARTPEAVHGFLERLWTSARPAAEREVAQVRDFARQQDDLQELMPWDFAHYSERLKKHLYDFDEEELRAYFPLDKVLEGMFQVAARLYKLSFTERTDIRGWHEDVRVFQVDRPGQRVGLFYVDLFPRETKQGGAWMTGLRDQGLWRGKPTRPHAAIVCNFTPSTPERPSLLRLDEVRTLFHEFGHALHGLLSDCTYQSMGGTSVYWDFVELPSQIMENWTTEIEGLALISGHWQTGAPVPAELVEKVRALRTFQAGYSCLRQLSFGFLDMAWHGRTDWPQEDLEAFEARELARTRVLPAVPGATTSAAFSHIFAGGYSSGYYSYKWAEVLDADAFEAFLEEGIFNPDTAERFRANILSRGNSAHPMDLYVAFRGRQPDPDALLRRDGLVS
jgi:peptidyl-dipeptidase Dcp